MTVKGHRKPGKKSGSHLTMGSGNGELVCRNCGERYRVNMPCSFSIWAASVTAFTKEHRDCPVRAGSPAARDADPPGTMTPGEWLNCGDCGISSSTIWSVMTGWPMPGGGRPDIPLDPDDFGRCFRLLERFPRWRGRLGEVVAAYPQWEPLVGAWTELEVLYREVSPGGFRDQLYVRMKELRGER